jgi:hypothetical protein
MKSNAPMMILPKVDVVPESILPTSSQVVTRRPERHKYLLIAPPKWGKTTFFSGVPDVCLLAFEAGYAEVDCPKIVITSWDRNFKEKREGWVQDEDGILYTSAEEVIEELEKNCPYKMVVIDTIDMATKMVSEYYCKLAGIDHPGEGGDFGRGWELYQTKPIRIFYNRLVRLGIGVACITHSTEKDRPNKFGQQKVKKETSLPGQVQHFVHTQSDVIMQGGFARLRRGQRDRDRYISFDGDNETMAGTRIRKVYVPNKYIVDRPTPDDDSPPWKQWESFFTNSPTAGKLAQENFGKLFVGNHDENLPETETETENKDDNKKESKFVKSLKSSRKGEETTTT